jgi:outer membrane receptor protein involved in Fe transport
MAAVLLSAGSAAVAQEQATATEASAAGPLQEITVTATRRSESLSKVPISVTALTQESMDDRGVKDFADVARFTPGVNFDNSGTNNISIRGISGTGGAGTTGIYLDDTPIQMRALAFNPDEALPKSFDIDRIEVLRGPQGTLFGAGSEGGTVRYISTPPSLSRASVYSREEVATTENGDLSYEAGRRRRTTGAGGIRSACRGVLPSRRRLDRSHQSGLAADGGEECQLPRHRAHPAVRSVGALGQLDRGTVNLLPGPEAQRHRQLLAAVLGPRGGQIRQCQPLAAQSAG